MKILPCGCTQGDPLQGQCERAYQLYDAMRKSGELYDLERETVSQKQSITEEDEITVQAAREHFTQARNDFQRHYQE